MRNLGLSVSLTVALALAAVGAPADAQTAVPAAKTLPQIAKLPPLTDFVGTYAYQGGTMEIAAG